MSDRELLRLAAKAAGYPIHSDAKWVGAGGGKPSLYMGERGPKWNPLTDDGDALRLAVDLQLLMNIGTEATFANNKVNGEQDKWAREQHKDSDPLIATRRAIVCAAAEIGKAMP